LLLPRLTSLGVEHILSVAKGDSLDAGRAKSILAERAAMMSFAASGGHRSEQLVAEISAHIRRIASESGFPDSNSQGAKAKFDQETAIYLGGRAELATGECLRSDVWSYLATVEAPDIVLWRFAKGDPDRFSGGVRNAFQRLWMRGSVLDRGESSDDRWGLVTSLTEDAHVAIFERPSIGGNLPLAKALAEGWVRTAARIGRGDMEAAMRRATKLLRLRNEIFDLSSLSREELDEVVAGCFEAA
jgi:hypothetical protein